MAIDWNATLGDAAKDLGNQLFTAAKDAAGDAWDEIEETNREQIQLLSVLLAQLKLRELVGEDVTSLVRHVKSQIGDLEFANKSIGARATAAFWEKALEITGSIIFGIAKTAIVGL